MRWNVTLAVTVNDQGTPLDLGVRLQQEAETPEAAIVDALSRFYMRNDIKPGDVLQLRAGAGSNEIDMADLPT